MEEKRQCRNDVNKVLMCEILKNLKHLNEKNDSLIDKPIWCLLIVLHAASCQRRVSYQCENWKSED